MQSPYFYSSRDRCDSGRLLVPPPQPKTQIAPRLRLLSGLISESGDVARVCGADSTSRGGQATGSALGFTPPCIYTIPPMIGPSSSGPARRRAPPPPLQLCHRHPSTLSIAWTPPTPPAFLLRAAIMVATICSTDTQSGTNGHRRPHGWQHPAPSRANHGSARPLHPERAASVPTRARARAGGVGRGRTVPGRPSVDATGGTYDLSFAVIAGET